MRTKNYLFMLFLVDLFVVLWGLAVAAQTFLIHPDKLVFPEENIRLLLLLFVFFAITSLIGLVASILYSKKKYIRYFSALQIAVFVALLAGKGLFG